MPLPWTVELSMQSFDQGYTQGRADTLLELAPLIEAARAYREARAAFGADTSNDAAREAWMAADAVLEYTARTFEAGHVEEDTSR